MYNFFSEKFGQTVQDIKDSEARLDRASADRFIKTIDEVKENEVEVLKSRAKLTELLKHKGTRMTKRKPELAN